MSKSIYWSLPLLVVTHPVFAETQSVTDPKRSNEHSLEHVLVTMPVHKSEARTALPVTVLTADELRTKAATTIGETLNHSPGLASASFGPAVGQPVIRGQQGPRVSVLQNSLPSLDVSSNSADHAVSVEAILADSIEVLRGPSTLLYGGGAIGGVVNVIDNRIPVRRLDGVQGAVEVRHGSVDDGQTNVARLDAGSGDWAFHFDGVYREWNAPEIPGLAVNATNVDDLEALEESSEGVLANADGRSHRYTLGTAYHFESGYLGISYSELNNLYGIPAGVHHAHHEEGEVEEEEEGGIRLDVNQRRWDVAGDWHREGFWEVLRWRAAYSDYEHSELEPDGGVGTVFSKEAWALRAELGHRELGPLHGVIGLQYQESDFVAEGEEAFVPASVSKSLGLFWLEDYHIDRWQFEAGLRADIDRLDSDEATLNDHRLSLLSGSFSALYDLDDNWTLSAAFSQARRAPTAEERFSNILNDPSAYVVHGASGAIELGDENLRREKSANIELSLRGDFERLSLDVTAFDNRFHDFIYLRNTGVELDEAPVLAYEQDDAHFLGLEYELTYQLLPVTAASTLQLRLFGDRVRAKLDGGQQVPRLPPQRDGLGLDWHYGAWKAGLSWIFAAEQSRPGQFEAETDAYQRVDATLHWATDDRDGNRYSVLLKLSNLGDEEIRSSTSFIRDYAPEPGRNIELGLRWEFGVQ